MEIHACSFIHSIFFALNCKMANMPFLALLLALASISYAKAAECQNAAPLAKMLSYNVTGGCDQSTPVCALKRGTKATIMVTFRPYKVDLHLNVIHISSPMKEHPSQVIDNLVVSLHGIILGFPIPFPLDRNDACRDFGLECPLKVPNRFLFVY